MGTNLKGAVILTSVPPFCDVEQNNIDYLRRYNVLVIEPALVKMAYHFLRNVFEPVGAKADRSEFYEKMIKPTPDMILVDAFRDFLPQQRAKHSIKPTVLRFILDPAAFEKGDKHLHDLTFKHVFYFLRFLRSSGVAGEADKANVWESIVAAITDTPFCEAWKDDYSILAAAEDRCRPGRVARMAAAHRYHSKQLCDRKRENDARAAALKGPKETGCDPLSRIQSEIESEAQSGLMFRMDKLLEEIREEMRMHRRSFIMVSRLQFAGLFALTAYTILKTQ
ncbi:hypothetical protein DFH06DRAFT_1129875 [Mycena polygramma]|nr:hypothetical protein DFH06DRAFT_1129875 [Mycena polygramma]